MKILIFTNHPFFRSGRIIREIEMLEPVCTQLVLVGNSFPNYISSKIIKIEFKTFDKFNIVNKIKEQNLRLKGIQPNLYKNEILARNIKVFLENSSFDVVILHDIAFIPYFLKWKKYKIVVNLHEYHPEEKSQDKRWMKNNNTIINSYYNNYLKKCDLIVNVSPGIQNLCIKYFGIYSIVVPNATKFYNLSPICNIGYPIKAVYHGLCYSSRGILELINIFKKLEDKYTLDLYLMPSYFKFNIIKRPYYSSVLKATKNCKNIIIKKPMKVDEIIENTRKYDLGILFFQRNVNNNYSLPNKLYEFIQARLAVIVTPLEDIGKLIDQYGFGRYSDDFSENSLIKLLKEIKRADIDKLKRNADRVASILTSESYQKLYLNEILKLFQKVS